MIGDILAKLGRGERLNDIELQKIRLWGNLAETDHAFVSGLQNGGSDVFTKSLNSLDFPFTPIFSEVLTVARAQFSVDIPSKFKNILIMGSGRTDVVAAGTEIVMQINGDTGSNYGTTADGVDNDTFTKGQTNSGTYMVVGLFPGTLATASASGMLFAYIFHANSDTFWKSVISTRGLFSGNMAFFGGFGQWKSTEKINKLIVGTSGNFLVGTTLSVYGIL